MLEMLILPLLAFLQLQMPSLHWLTYLRWRCNKRSVHFAWVPAVVKVLLLLMLWPGFLAKGCILALAGIPAISEILLLLTLMQLLTSIVLFTALLQQACLPL